MYLPPHFDASNDLSVLHALYERDNFATLVSQHEGAPYASHLPLLLETSDNALTLLGHWAKPNPQWTSISGQTVMAVFHGPHAYVSPTWYPAPRESVPTWNYAVAHLYGTVELVTAQAGLLQLVDRLARRFEADDDTGWRLADTEPAVPRMAAGIVGFRLAVQKVQIKLKLGQNHPAEKRAGAVTGLLASGASDAGEVARWMVRHNDKGPAA
jgi:transcriptional regulator